MLKVSSALIFNAMKKLLLLPLLFFAACQQRNSGNDEAQEFLDGYTSEYIRLYSNTQLAQWKSNTEIIAGDSSNMVAAQRADEAMAAFTGSEANIHSAKEFLNEKASLTPIQQKQLEAVLYAAANNPQTIADVVKQRIKAENEQIQKLYGYQYMLNGKKVTTNELDELLKKEKDPVKRLAVWEASKAVGPSLKDGLVRLRDLRNQTVQALDYPDYFTYQVSDYGLNTGEMMALMDGLIRDLWPLYRELHTWMRYEMAAKYGASQVPDLLPAHWLPNRWGQDWSSAVEVQGLNLDSVLKPKGPQWIATEAENLYVSLGFPKLPAAFWTGSSLYPYKADSTVKKNNHASAWHMDLNKDVRSLMSIEPNSEWWETANHELGHIYYYLSYSNDSVPPLLRQGANRAYHEAVGSMMGMAAMQKAYLVGRGLIGADVKTDSIRSLLKEALNSVVFIFFSSGTMSNFEKQIYTDKLPPDQWNAAWWGLAKKYQGIAPPSPRGEE